jgi:5-methylcytosine-specific restriction endonuclease McrA
MGQKGKRHKEKRGRMPIGTCVYCGAVGQTESEDVIPRCLFLKPEPSRILVPSCRFCNLKKSKDDPYLRDMLAADYRSHGNPIAQELFNGPILRSMRRNMSLIARSYNTAGQMTPIMTHGGIYLGDMPGVPLDAERLQRIYSNIVRGLTFDARGERLPNDTRFTWKHRTGPSSPEEFERLRQAPWDGTRGIGQNVFECGYISGERRHEAVWLLIFYSSVYVMVISQPANAPDIDWPT